MKVPNIFHKHIYMITTVILVLLFTIINASRMLYGYKNNIILAIQLALFIIILYGLEIFHKMLVLQDKYSTPKGTLAIMFLLTSVAGIFIAMTWFLDIVGIHSILVILTSSYLLWKIIPVYFLGKTKIFANLRKLLIRSCATTLVAIFVLTSTSYTVFTATTASLNDFAEISQFVEFRTYPVSVPFSLRSYNDIYMWSLFGIGACGEKAYIAKTILESKGYEAYVAGFPGEDHMFTVVFVNGSWWALDPGYDCCRSVSMVERVRYRMQEMGNISSIIVYLDDNEFIDLTRYYVPYDVYVFNITYNGNPVAGACITLRHLFDGKPNIEIPGKGCYYTNVSGIAVVYLGGSGYNKSNLGKWDPYFEVYVNGEPTGIRVRSTATGKMHLISIDLAKLDKDN
ncbi:MAG: transglutaminase domain-containing protein [Staphylothermus sp.]|nr:transglutaminase domain-containing protein [Staphylothermus sp.]